VKLAAKRSRAVALDDVLALVRRRTGLTLPPGPQILPAVNRAMERLRVAGRDAGAEALATDELVFEELLAELTVGESYFLREDGQFGFIQREVIPGLRRLRGPDHTLYAWSAGCASGQEPYSLAIVAQEAGLAARMRVLGTDIVRRRLEEAKRGVYGDWSLRGVPPDIIARHFIRKARRVELVPAIRAAVEFRYLNLADTDWRSAGISHQQMDLILCRNVLIYFDSETIAGVLHRLVDSLADGGWLFLGASDPPVNGIPACEVVITGAGVAYRKVRRGRSTVPLPAPARETASSRPAFHREPGAAATARAPAGNGAQATRVEPAAEAASGLLARAQAAYDAGDNARAAELAAELLRHRPDETASVVFVRALANMNQLAEASTACIAGLERHRTSPELTYLHGILLRQSGRIADAAAAFRRAIYLNRAFAVAHLALGDARLAEGDRTGAVRSFRNADQVLASAADGDIIPASDGMKAAHVRRIIAARLQLASGARE
jgi:chemotaxis protein methyltransferase CheR